MVRERRLVVNIKIITDNMLKRQLGNTGISASVIGLGGGQFADSNHTFKQMRKIILTALKNGINIIDTAVDYGEKRMGRALSDINNNYHISSKTLAKNKSDTLEDVKNSLKKLKQDKIDIYYMHNPMDVEDYKNRKDNGVLEGLREAKEEGIINNIGVSCDYVEPLEIAINDNIDVIMNQYNIGNTLGENIIRKAARKNIGVVASKPFAGGILVDPKTEIENGKNNDMTADKALKFTLSNENISTAFVGARYPWQIEECAEIGQNFDRNNINRSKIKKEVLNFLSDDFCRDCRYCWPCEELGYDFDIPEMLRFLDRYEKYGFKRFPRIEFSKLNYTNKIKDIGKCDVYCPFNIDIAKRLKVANEKLSLSISKDKWINSLKLKMENVSDDVIVKIKEIIANNNKKETIEKIHTELIPSGRINEEFGIFLIKGINSFRSSAIIEALKIVKKYQK